MNCLTEALGLSLPGNGSVLATHADREELFLQAGRTAVALCKRWYEQDDDRALIAIEAENGLSRARIAAAIDKVGLPAATSVLDQLAGGVQHSLVEVPGMIADSDPRLRDLATALGLENGRVAAIGAYAVPATATART